MAGNPNLGWTGVQEGQASKEVTINGMGIAIDNAITEIATIDLSQATPSAPAAITADILAPALTFVLSGATAAVQVGITPAKKLARWKNTGTFNVTLVVGATNLVVPAGQTIVTYMDGTTNGIEAFDAGSNGNAIASASDFDNTTPATDGQTIVWSQSEGKFKPGSSGGAIRSASDYDNTSAPTDGQAIVWNQAEGKYKPGTVASSGTGGGGGGGSLATLSDVDESVTPLDGQALIYDGVEQKWKPETLTGGTSSGGPAGSYTYYKFQMNTHGNGNNYKMAELALFNQAGVKQTPTHSVASSVYNNNADNSADLYDGSNSTEWVGLSGNATDYIIYTFGSAFACGEISVTAGDDYSQAPVVCRLYGSNTNNGSDWVDLGGVTFQTWTTNYSVQTKPTVAGLKSSDAIGSKALTCKTVSIFFPAGTGYFAFSLVELTLLDLAGNPIAYPTGTAATAYATDGGSATANAIDGNTGTFWTSGNQTNNSGTISGAGWYEVTLGSEVSGIGGIQITARGGGAGPQTPGGMQVSFGTTNRPDGSIGFALSPKPYADNETRIIMFAPILG